MTLPRVPDPEIGGILDQYAAAIEALQGGGGGFTPVSCVLESEGNLLDLHASSGGPYQWSAVVDNIWDFNDLGGVLPDGLGISFADNSGTPTDLAGTDGTLVTTEAGVWAFTLYAAFPIDATFVGRLSDGGNNQVASCPVIPLADTFGAYVTLSVTHALPVGAMNAFDIAVIHAPTNSPYNAFARLEIVRLA